MGFSDASKYKQHTVELNWELKSTCKFLLFNHLGFYSIRIIELRFAGLCAKLHTAFNSCGIPYLTAKIQVNDVSVVGHHTTDFLATSRAQIIVRQVLKHKETVNFILALPSGFIWWIQLQYID